MTPKEKAAKLVSQMASKIYYGVAPVGSHKMAKACAIIAVDELMDLLVDVSDMTFFESRKDYLESVKAEIEAL